MQTLLDRLERGIAQGRMPREIPFLRAERAVLLVRLGEVERARKELFALRGLPESHSNAALNAWLWLGDGLSDYFENLGQRSRDRVQRALALAQTAKAPRIQALAAAWCAHLDFRAQDYAATVEHLRLALQTAPADHHSARSRAAVVLAGAYHFAGREDLAQPWYVQARSHAAIEGDAATLSSITYNLAALRVMQVRLDEMFGELDPVVARRALVGTESSAFLDQSSKTLALTSLTAMQRALILSANGAWADALKLYEAHMPQALAEGLSISECLYQADRAQCLLRLGRGDESLSVARHADSALAWSSEPEERALTHALLARVFEPLGLRADALRHAERSSEAWGSHQQRCLAMLQMLDAARFQLDAPPR